MMNHRGYAQQASGPPGHFIGFGERIATGGGVVLCSGGIQAGDVAVCLSVSTTNAGNLATLLLLSSLGSGQGRFSSSVLSGGDVSNGGPTLTGGSGATSLVGIYRGPSAATLPTFGFNDNTTSSPIVCPGFTKNAGALVIPYLIGTPVNPTLGAAPGTLRHITSDGRVGLADFDPASLYTNGTAESWPYISLVNIILAPVDLH